MVQYVDGSEEWAADGVDRTMFYFLANYKIDEKNNITLRFDDASEENQTTALSEDIDAITFAWNHKVSENSMMQLEYITPDVSVDALGGDVETNDDMFQIRYKVHF